MSTVNKRHAQFIQEMIDHGDQVQAYRTAYPKASEESARVKSYSLLQNVTIAAKIREGLAEKEAIIREARKQELQAQAREKILSVTEVDARLSEIINGTWEQEKKIVVLNRITQKFEVVTLKEKPDASQIVAACDKFYKRHGHYAPKKFEDVTKPTVIVPGEDDN